jgi:hypothetical protein
LPLPRGRLPARRQFPNLGRLDPACLLLLTLLARLFARHV